MAETMGIMGVFGVLFYIVMVCVNALIAGDNDRNIWLVVIFSIILSPLPVYLYLLAVGQRKKEEAKKND